MTVHETRVEPAFALNGFVVFCSCGNLTGFADDAAGADKIAADHCAVHDWTKRAPHFQAYSDGYLAKIAKGAQGAKRAAFAKAEVAARAGVTR